MRISIRRLNVLYHTSNYRNFLFFNFRYFIWSFISAFLLHPQSKSYYLISKKIVSWINNKFMKMALIRK